MVQTLRIFQIYGVSAQREIELVRTFYRQGEGSIFLRFCAYVFQGRFLNWEKVKESTVKLENGQFLSECGFVQDITPSSLSHDRWIK